MPLKSAGKRQRNKCGIKVLDLDRASCLNEFLIWRSTLFIRSAQEAHADIGHHFGALAKLSREVHDDFRRDCRVIAPILNTSTRASIYRQIFLRKLRDYCDETSGAHFYNKSQLFLVGLENKYVFRVKQLRDGFQVAVSPTEASEKYDANELPGYASDLLEGYPEATLLYLGWSIPENSPADISLYLVCNDENREVLWSLPLEGGDDGRGIQESLPITGGESGIRVRIKGDEERKANG
jgi:hypothetical protein